MIARTDPSGKSIVFMITISYFLGLHGPPARPPADAPGGRAPRLLLARRARAPSHAAGGEHAAAPARARARPPPPRPARPPPRPSESRPRPATPAPARSPP